MTIIGDIQERDGVSYVIPEEGAVEEAVQKLMTAPEGSTGDETTASSGSPEGGTEATSPSSTTTTESTDSFITDPDEIANSRLWSQLAAAAPFPVLAPGYLPEGYAYVDRMPVEGGAYDIVVDGDKTEPAIKMVYRLTNVEGTETDQYMGIMETTWLDAPAAGAGTQVAEEWDHLHLRGNRSED